MSLASTSTYNEYAIEIITSALELAGGVSPGENPSPRQLESGRRMLNRLIKHLQTGDTNLWVIERKALSLLADTASYTLDTDTIGIGNVVLRRDGSDDPLRRYGRDEYYNLNNLSDSGDPIAFYLDKQRAAPVLYLYFVPENATSVVVGTDGNDYRCKLNHTSTSATKPVTGASYATYWEATGGTGSGSAWAVDTAYKSDVVWYDKHRTLKDVTHLNDNIEFPQRWIKAIVDKLAYDMSLMPDYRGDTDRLLRQSKESMFSATHDDNERGEIRLQPKM